MNKKYFAYIALCIALLCLAGGAIIGFFIGGMGAGSELDTLQQYVDRYYTGGEYNEAELLDSALHSYIDRLGDPYSSYYNADELEQVNQTQSGKYAGIGISVEEKDGIYTVTDVNKNGPAFRAGIQVGDTLISFNGTAVTGMSMSEFNGMAAFEVDEDVMVVVKRQDTEHTYTMKSEIIQKDMAEMEMLDGIAYIRITNFYGNAATLVSEFVTQATAENCRGFIVDIRSNPGGDLSVLQSVAGCFVGNKEVLKMVYKDGAEDVYNGNGTATTQPLVVLVDGNSASASEAFAGCIQSHGRGKIVGTQTYGKGIAQQTFSLADGTAVKLTVAKYYLPDGRCIHGEGITPDHVIELPKDVVITRENDTQLAEAIKLINQ